MLGLAAVAASQPVAVRNHEGLVHGFLVLSAADGSAIADGALLQTTSGTDQVTSRLVFHFKDGSLQDETVAFSQQRVFRVLTNHLVQKGPSFPREMDARIDARSGRVTVRWKERDGKQEEDAEQMTLPDDLLNGLVLTVLKNVPEGAHQIVGHMVAFTPKPRLVKLEMTGIGAEAFVLGETTHRAVRYRVRPKLGGLLGLLAPLVGKQPPDAFVWIMGGEAPAFVKFEGSMFLDGPPWRMELISPRWGPAPHAGKAASVPGSAP
jgi:hypothetical protein